MLILACLPRPLHRRPQKVHRRLVIIIIVLPLLLLLLLVMLLVRVRAVLSIVGAV